jgi:hypothetical protein
VLCKVKNYYKTHQKKLNPGVGGAAFSTSFSVQGVATFDGEGRGTVYGRAVSINPPSSLTLWIEGASSEKFSYEFFYKIGDDGEITTWLVPGSFKGTFLTGRRAIYPAQTFTIPKKTLSVGPLRTAFSSLRSDTRHQDAGDRGGPHVQLGCLL